MTTADTTTGATTLKFEPTRKRIRILLGGELVADTTDAMLVWEVPYYPAYYIPARDVRAALGDPEVLTVKVNAAAAEAGARRYPASSVPELRDFVRFEWAAMSEWLEE